MRAGVVAPRDPPALPVAILAPLRRARPGRAARLDAAPPGNLRGASWEAGGSLELPAGNSGQAMCQDSGTERWCPRPGGLRGPS